MADIGYVTGRGSIMPRFTCVAEPGGTWMVWDKKKEAPAALGDKTLTGMNKYRAEAACGVLERIDLADHKRTVRQPRAGLSWKDNGLDGG